ncbi:MAG TPA: HAMP domain-containing sensor histidine kinase [Patescibacteria group bacterium]|nr:HAMP domain-containing sensor histidine kinase [Patescibacteria group bacterium]
MFRSALVKLTGLYLLILMLVSLFFSFNVYRIATFEVNNRLRRQGDFFTNSPGFSPDGNGPNRGPNPFEQERVDEVEASQQHILLQLLYANLAILIFGGAGSYFLARRTLEPIEEAHDAQVRFTADASHELRTPLAAMRAETEVTLRNPGLDIEEAREQLKSNLEELERLTALSDGLLQLARGIDTASLDETVKLAGIIQTASAQVKSLASAKHIELKLPPTKAFKVHGSKTQLVQALVILLDNAIKYSPPHSHVLLKLLATQQQATIEVIDQGRGIAETDLPHIFERFYRADSSRTQADVQGYGLGLPIAHQIVEAHGGELAATSTPGEGSRFTISLPLAKA